ncbi:MAG: hypothetical protein AB1414_16775 [bacterium]
MMNKENYYINLLIKGKMNEEDYKLCGKIDLLDLLGKGKITEEEAYDIFENTTKDWHDGKIKDMYDAEFLCFSQKEWTGFPAGLSSIANWRKNGWPTKCYFCSKSLDTDQYGWMVFEDDEDVAHIVHIDCMPTPKGPVHGGKQVMDLLERILTGEISEDEAYEIYNNAVHEFRMGRLPSELGSYFGFSLKEWKAFEEDGDLSTIANWRKNGWPTKCYWCSKHLNTDHDEWTIYWDDKSKAHIIHVNCEKK